VPAESEQYWTVATIIVVIVLNQSLCNVVVDLLVVGVRWLEDLWCVVGRRLLVVVEVVSTTSKSSYNTTNEETVVTALWAGRVSVAAASLLTESIASDCNARSRGGAKSARECAGCGCHFVELQRAVADR